MVKKKRIGVVVSNKSEKTIIVAIQIRYPHPKYLKTLVKTKRYLAHDEKEESNIGDIVLIEEHRPISKLKTWTLKKIVQSYQQIQEELDSVSQINDSNLSNDSNKGQQNNEKI
jgi:small subunit ribosomal protein S17